MMMDAVKIGTLPTTKPLLSNKIYESTDSLREKIDDISFTEDNEDEEMRLRLSDEEDNEQENISSNVQNHQANSQLKKDDVELDAPATVDSEEKSDNGHLEFKKVDISTEQVDTPTYCENPKEKSEGFQLELEDSDSRVKQVDTPVSLTPEEKPEPCQQESENPTESIEQVTDSSDLVNPEEASETRKEEVNDSEESDEQHQLSSNGDLDEEFVTENGSVSDEESDSSDKMSHNHAKYWVGGFDTRPWKGGARKRASFAHRGSKSWRHQQFPDRDKLKKNNLHHSNSHFIRTSRSRGNFGSSARDSWSRDARRSDTNDSLRSRDKITSRDVSGGKDNLMKQNGVLNGLDHKENNSSSQNDKTVTVTNKVGVKSNSTIQKRIIDGKLSSDQNGKVNDSGVKLLSGIAATMTKNCDMSFDKGKSSSQSSETPEISEIPREAQIQIKDVTSQNSGVDTLKDSMALDENINDKPDSTSDLICIQSNVRDSREKNSKNDDISCVIVQDKSNGTLLETFSEIGKDTSVKNYQSLSVDDTQSSSQILNNDDDWRDSESGSLVIDESMLGKSSNDKDNAEVREVDATKSSKEAEKSSVTKNKDQSGLHNVIEEVDLIDDDSQEATLKSGNTETSATLSVPIDTINGDKDGETNEEGRAAVHKRRRRKRLAETMQEELLASESENLTRGNRLIDESATRHKMIDEFFTSVKLLIENGIRQKRRSARNAEEMIRKDILKGNDDENSSDDADKLVRVNYRKSSTPNIITRTLSPPTHKRTLDDVLDDRDNMASMTLKRIRPNTEDATMAVAPERTELLSPIKSKESVAAMGQLMREISQEDIRKKLKKLKQEELEALLLQKVAECITVRGEVGKLREQARASKKTQESLRNKCQLLQKQVEGFDMVLKRINYDKNNNGDKYVPPIKINRSVGLQVNFLSPELGVQNLKQMRAKANGMNSPKPASMPMMTQVQDNHQSPRKMMKTRSPRRPDMPTNAMVQVASVPSTSAQANNPNATLVMAAKPNDPNAKRNGNVLQFVAQPANQQQTAANRSTLTIQRTATPTASASRANDLIDLTDEEDKSKISTVVPITTAGTPARLSRVLQAVPTGVTLGNATNLRIVPAPNSQASMGNNVPRLTYVMQSGPNGSSTRQLVIASNNSMKTVTSLTGPGINYKRGVSGLPSGAVRLVTTQAPTVQVLKHPAPLPEMPMPPSDPSWKLAPPAPSLKISKVATGIVLSWNMSISDKYAEIASYQLYAYQEVAGTTPSANLWKKVGDVRALPLPMACTLTQFAEGNNYYFAVRAVDAHSRFGQYSKPGNISL